MTLYVTNTLTGEREPFEPENDDQVLLYLCGLTTSDPAHVGHARTWTHTDVIHRWLDYLGYDVRHVENFTDVNEKIVARVGEVGGSEADVARTYIQDVIRDMRSLNLRRAEVYPRVSEHVPEIIDLIRTLVDRGHAYESNGSVYFDVSAFEEYGKLSNQEIADQEARGDEEDQVEDESETREREAGRWRPDARHRPEDGPAEAEGDEGDDRRRSQPSDRVPAVRADHLAGLTSGPP